MTTKMNRFWAIAALCVMVTGFTACLKSSDTTPQRPPVLVSLIQGISSTDALDFYDNGTKVPTNAPIGLGFGAYNYRTTGGVHEFSFNKTGLNAAYVSIFPQQYDSLNYYTIVTYGDSTAPQAVAVKDDFTNLTQNTLSLRFFHLASTIGAVDLYINNQKVDSNLTYRAGALPTTFKTQTAVNSGSSISVKLAGTQTIVASLNTSSNTTVNLQSGYAYTIYLTGLNTATSGVLAPAVNYIPSFY